MRFLHLSFIVRASAITSSLNPISLADCRLQLQECETPIIQTVANIMGVAYNYSDIEDNDDSVLEFVDEHSDRLISMLHSFAVTNTSITNLKKQEYLPTLIRSECMYRHKLRVLALARVQIGVSVAKAKLRSNPALYRRLVQQGDLKSVRDSLTDAKVEQILIGRLKEKTRWMLDEHPKCEHIASLVAELYENILIPITKDIEVHVISKLANSST